MSKGRPKFFHSCVHTLKKMEQNKAIFFTTPLIVIDAFIRGREVQWATQMTYHYLFIEEGGGSCPLPTPPNSSSSIIESFSQTD